MTTLMLEKMPSLPNTSPSSVESLILTTSTDPFTRGLDYLYGLRSLAIEPDMIEVMHDPMHRAPVATWIGNHIDAVNAQLQALVQACHDCFHPTAQPPIQIWAAPLAQSYKICGLCNLEKHPIAILVDVGRVIEQDWLALVVHEYAHAQVGSPGHHQDFAAALIHLCRGLAIDLPTATSDQDDFFRLYPACQMTANALSWWQGSQPTIVKI